MYCRTHPSTFSRAMRLKTILPRVSLKQPATVSTTLNGYSKITSATNPIAAKETPLPFHAVPGPTVLEAFTEIWRKGIGQFHQIIENNFEKYGPLYKFTLPNTTPLIYISHPEDIDKVFRGDGYPPLRSKGLELMRMYHMDKGLSEGIFSNDENWHRHRQSIAPYLLRPFEIRHLVPLVCGTSDYLISSFQQGRNEDLVHRFLNWSTKNVALAMFGFDIDVKERPNETASDFINAILIWFEMEEKAMMSLPVYKWFFTPTRKRAYRALDTISNITSSYIGEASKLKALSQIEKPVIQKVLESNKHKLTKEELIQLTSTVFAGGVDTTALTAIGVLQNLSKFPRVQRKLYEEIRRVLPNDEKPTHIHLADMPYLRATIKESLRINPVIIATVRQSVIPLVLSGYEIPAGTLISLSNFCSKAVSTEKFVDFEDFRPERWVRGSQKIHPFASIPFSQGVRMCPGMRLAQMEVSTLLIRMLQKFEIENSQLVEDQVDWKFNVFMHLVRPFNLKLKQRN